MPNLRPDPARIARRIVVVLASIVCMGNAIAAPEFAGFVARSAQVPAPTDDPLLRLLADQPSSDAATALPVPAAEISPAAPGESRFVSRMRDTASDMVLTAMNFLGVPYRRGGESAARGFDCSGFTRHIFEMSLGRVLPRRADEQAAAAGLIHIDRDELRPGDLVFFNTMRRTFSHVGIYVGAGKFIHSPRPGGEVRVDDMHATYWGSRFTGGRRVESATTPDPLAQLARQLN